MKTGTTIALFFAAALAAFAQTNASPAAPTNAPAHPAVAPAVPPPPARPARQIPFSGLPYERFLNQEQRNIFREARAANQEKIQSLNTKIRSLRDEMFQLVLAEKFDEAAFLAKSEAVGKTQTEIETLYVQAFLKIRPLLTTNQIQLIRDPQAPPHLNETKPTGDPDSRPHLAAPPTP